MSSRRLNRAVKNEISKTINHFHAINDTRSAHDTHLKSISSGSGSIFTTDSSSSSFLQSCSAQTAQVDHVSDEMEESDVDLIYDDAVSEIGVDEADGENDVLSEDDGENDVLSEDDGENDVLSEEEKASNLAIDIALWVSTFNISHAALSALLLLLRFYFPYLPKDARTVMKTPRSCAVRTVGSGTYFHFAIWPTLSRLKPLLNFFTSNFNACSRKVTNILLQINIDGLPIFKSSSVQFWPILGKVSQPINSEPFLIGIFHGNQKPSNLDEYLHDFVEDVSSLRERPFQFPVDDRHVDVQVDLSCFICDAPARSFLKKTKGHTGYYGCEKCKQRGTWQGKITFPDVGVAALRTDEGFKHGVDNDDPHHSDNIPSPLLRHLDIKMVTQFPLDCMHLVYLGVMRRLLVLWLRGPVDLHIRLSQGVVRQISECLSEFRSYIPREFARKCRDLSEVDRWKATEFRQFLLVSGIVALKDKLKIEYYRHFLLLFVGIYCLANPILVVTHIDYAHECLCQFVRQAAALYGDGFIVYNVHGLTHLANDVRQFGPLDAYSAFPFENFLRQLKPLVRKPQLPLQQVVRRIKEKMHQGLFDMNRGKQLPTDGIPLKEHMQGPIPRLVHADLIVGQFQKIFLNKTCLSIFKGDNCIKIHDYLCLIVNILSIVGHDAPVLVVKKLTKVQAFFDNPFDSRHFGVFKCSDLSAVPEAFPIAEVENKMVMLPHKESFILIPLSVAF
jgi:hypothetical protein